MSDREQWAQGAVVQLSESVQEFNATDSGCRAKLIADLRAIFDNLVQSGFRNAEAYLEFYTCLREFEPRQLPMTEDGIWVGDHDTLTATHENMKLQLIDLALQGQFATEEYRYFKTVQEKLAAAAIIFEQYRNHDDSLSASGPAAPRTEDSVPSSESGATTDQLVTASPSTDRASPALPALDQQVGRMRRPKAVLWGSNDPPVMVNDIYWPAQSYQFSVNPLEINSNQQLLLKHEPLGDIPIEWTVAQATAGLNKLQNNLTKALKEFALLLAPERPDWSKLMENGEIAKSSREPRDLHDIPLLPRQYPELDKDLQTSNWSLHREVGCVIFGVGVNEMEGRVSAAAEPGKSTNTIANRIRQRNKEQLLTRRIITHNSRSLRAHTARKTGSEDANHNGVSTATDRAALIINGCKTETSTKQLRHLTNEEILYNLNGSRVLDIFAGTITNSKTGEVLPSPTPHEVPSILADMLIMLGRKVPTLNWLFSEYPFLPRGDCEVTGKPDNVVTVDEDWTPVGTTDKNCVYGLKKPLRDTSALGSPEAASGNITAINHIPQRPASKKKRGVVSGPVGAANAKRGRFADVAEPGSSIASPIDLDDDGFSAAEQEDAEESTHQTHQSFQMVQYIAPGRNGRMQTTRPQDQAYNNSTIS
ncbi:hypothetical protein EJ08DRAFT_680195 [Tothia fuscella]|uniref:Uncharacterized protein n=1 Tax=Tothia fuscella TaxID=1048955 RepID=A0A9P4NP11_9PEZI|nr:hypothetical protein EJ08DRAFT_680195 [Tothia fuscella]